MFELFTLGRDQAIRIALVLALIAGATAAAFGIGYRSSDAVLGDGSAYVQKGHTVIHVNGESGQADAKAARDLATGRQGLEVVQVRPGVVYVVNNVTDEVWQLPTDTMRPERVDTGPRPQAPAGPAEENETVTPPAEQTPPKPRSELISGGGVAYLLQPEPGTLSLLQGQRTVPVALPVKVVAAVVDMHGTAWALSKQDGVLYEISGSAVRNTHTVAIPGEAARLTLTNGKPVVFLPERGTGGLIRVIGSGDEPSEMVVEGQPDGALHVATPGGADNVFVTVDQREDQVVVTDLRTGAQERHKLEGRSGPRAYGRPVVAQGFIYVPDYTRRQVVVLSVRPLRQVRAVTVPGREPYFVVFERDGRVWVNDPYARTLLSFHRDQWREADKGTGNGVDEDDGPNPSPTPARSTAPPRPSPRPSPSPVPPRRVSVPNVGGMTADQACAAVTTAELTCQPPVTRQQPGCVTGQALNSEPAAGSLVPVRSQVTVFICGPTAVPGPLVGMPVDQACRTLEAAGLVCQPVDGGPAPAPGLFGVVTAQNPPNGTPVPNGSTVQVAYYTGIPVPAITGIAPDQACGTLQAWGLQCAPNPEAITWQANVVQAQSHPAGTPVQPGTPIGYAYQDTPASALNRWKKSGEEVRFLSVGPLPPAGSWAPQPAIGGVYRWGEAVPGLIPVMQFYCASNCGDPSRSTAFYYRGGWDTNPPNARWVYQGPAFTCFEHQQPGTVALKGMFNDRLGSWAFAPAGSWEWEIHRGAGYDDRTTICHLWYGVPGFP